MHKLLHNQLKRHLGRFEDIDPGLRAFITAVDQAYEQANEDRLLLERSLDLTSNELLERNAQLRLDISERLRQENLHRNRADRLRLQNDALIELAKREQAYKGDLVASLRDITETASRYLDVARASVWLFNDSRTVLRCADLYELYRQSHSDGVELCIEDFPTYFRSLETNRCVSANDARTDPSTCEFAESYLIPQGITSMLDAGIRKGGYPIGVLCHEHTGPPREWSPEEELFAASLADMATLAMESAKRRKTEEALEESHAMLQATFESTIDGILVVDSQGLIISFNKRFIELWGIPEDIVASRSDERALAFVLSQLSDPEGFLSKVRELYAQPEASSFDVLAFHDGRTFERVSLPQRIGGVCNGRVWNFRDVTETRRTQDELLRAKRLEAAGQLAGQIAHDFNNLLGPLVAYPEILRNYYPTDKRTEKILGEMESAAQQIVDINQQLLTLGRRGHFGVEPLYINDVVEQALHAAQVPKGILVVESPANDLWVATGNASQIVRVLVNLIVNAVDAMDGSGKLTLETSNEHLEGSLGRRTDIVPGDYARIRVADTGPGMSPEIQDKVFEPFFTTKKADKKRGSGLGLSVVHSVLEDHKGYLELDSAPGRGTAFTLYFPADRHAALPQSTPRGAIRRGNARLLVVDDDTIQRDVLRTTLGSLGYEVVVRPSGEEAVVYLRDATCDLVILDMVMNGIDGTETLRQIRSIHPSQRCLILSGYAQGERVEEALRLGATAFVAKPVQAHVLAKAVHEALSTELSSTTIPAHPYAQSEV